ncbi:TetR/AcrR family transcriptional regulator [Gordonia hankookensis]|uniref:TetR/AcrR family transcriptional regulator n=1 Tax=Gordonia hankookensis TaxID=589403 RepID=A0ABR7W9G0_9ACTN|nr:TetR/AcrR family transcriptional regulator [Gordonia hankookensis]MBD1319186.1 TetR/AcrR family transcriptional regulator [Gordonia hankookensis]NDZ93472.1 TetR/AcrR family transcriptional regulator [Streptomyces sp. SID11726]NEB27256.1 TetR/AcrR family transcriptional regulator [Streptomyces sp. SID6673]
MRTHGWGGRVPRNDDEATARILAATRTVIDRRGASTSIADVARELDVTRQTVYRYFASTEVLLSATALDAVGALLDRMTERLRGITAADGAVVEGVAGVLEELRDDDYVGLLLRDDRLSVPVVGEITSEIGRVFARSMVDRMDVDWAGAGYADRDLDIVVEIVLRTLQSMVIDPGSPGRSASELREFLDVWMGASIRGLVAAPRRGARPNRVSAVRR